MKAKKKPSLKKTTEEPDQISETRKRLLQQRIALKKIIQKFDKKNKQ